MKQSARWKSILVAIIFFLLIVLPIAIVIMKEKIFTPKEVQVIFTDTTKQENKLSR